LGAQGQCWRAAQGSRLPQAHPHALQLLQQGAAWRAGIVGGACAGVGGGDDGHPGGGGGAAAAAGRACACPRRSQGLVRGAQVW